VNRGWTSLFVQTPSRVLGPSDQARHALAGIEGHDEVGGDFTGIPD
jgi:hypothetical protein